MSLDQAIAKSVGEIPECLAGGYVDLTTGMLLGIKTVDSHPQEVMDILAAATADLFQGPNVSTIESLFKKARGVADDGHHYFQEIVIMSDNLVHIFLRMKSNEEHVVTFVCRKSVNLGMALTKSRQAMTGLDGAV
ncbi:hypothetical protein [Thiohalophilus thiocyanatoxydans]|uniref:Uncharacterized protein n=1 Tax=Thiohalophilus thiocyanatoxydans TaxID=381308 RepID=A0A4R8IHN5_9GAMM|nr:hypothetical protein [Thiohalophilus thiocyanatoxydans]TDX99633.1 hypothetical protein EDC23_2418 [Thiohalophilus thiocyanatoxydans]